MFALLRAISNLNKKWNMRRGYEVWNRDYFDTQLGVKIVVASCGMRGMV